MCACAHPRLFVLTAALDQASGSPVGVGGAPGSAFWRLNRASETFLISLFSKPLTPRPGPLPVTLCWRHPQRCEQWGPSPKL